MTTISVGVMTGDARSLATLAVKGRDDTISAICLLRVLASFRSVSKRGLSAEVPGVSGISPRTTES